MYAVVLNTRDEGGSAKARTCEGLSSRRVVRLVSGCLFTGVDMYLDFFFEELFNIFPSDFLVSD